MPIELKNINNFGNIRYSNLFNYGGISMSITTPIIPVASGSPYQQLDIIATYLRNYMPDFRNSNFFAYRLDGNSYQILDGGNDMFDQGNYTAPWLLNGTNYSGSTFIPTNVSVNYATTSSALIDSSFYYVSLGYEQFGLTQSITFLPLTAIGSRSGSGSTGFQKAGNIGADGGGNISIGSIYSGSTVNGFTTYAYYRQTFAQSVDPTICDVYILLGHPNWGTTFGTVISSSIASTNLQGAALYSSGSNTKNVLAITTLLSRPSPNSVTTFDIKTVVDNFTLRIKESLGY